MKTLIRIILLFISINVAGISFAEPINCNSKMYVYTYIYPRFFVVLPDDTSELNYLRDDFISGILFINLFDESLIDRLTIKDIRYHCLERRFEGEITPPRDAKSYPAGAVKFYEVKGLIEMSNNIRKLDEFGVAEKKDEVISLLKKAHMNYKNEHNRLIRGRVYRFKTGSTYRVGIGPLNRYRNADKINRKAYDIDKKLLTLKTLGSFSEGQWENEYSRKVNESYGGRLVFKEDITIPLSVKDAKLLFQEGGDVYYETVVEASMATGFINFNPSTNYVQNMRIERIIKIFYKDKLLTGDPILVLEITPSSKIILN
jgi:hypothetical protein